MVSKFTRDKFIVLAVLALAIYFYYYAGFEREALIEDHFQFYDEFSTGFRSDLWESTENSKPYGGDCQYVGKEYSPTGAILYNAKHSDCTRGTYVYNKEESDVLVYEQECLTNTCNGQFVRYAQEPENLKPQDLKCEIWSGQIATSSPCTGCRSGSCYWYTDDIAKSVYKSYGTWRGTACSCTQTLDDGVCAGTYSSSTSGECGGYRDVNYWDGNSKIERTHYIRVPATTELNLVTVQDGWMKLRSSSPYNGAGGYSSSSVVSKKKFSTEDIKIKFKYFAHACSGSGGCANTPGGSISYGGTSLPVTSGAVTQSVHNGRQTTNEGIIEIKRYDDLDLRKFVVVLNGEEVAQGRNENPEPIKFNGNIEIDYIKFQPYFSCAVDYTTEVVVRDKFLGGNTIDINDLTYEAVKFCPQDLGVLIYSQFGLTDEKGSLTAALAAGEELKIPNDQYWQFDYISKYVDDMGERCNQPGQVYDVESRSCIQVTTQQVPTDVLLSCSEDADCIVPVGCDATVSCISNQCDYQSAICTPQQIINEVLVLKTLEIKEPEIIIITTGTNSVSISEDSTVAGYSFSSPRPTFICEENRDEGYNNDPFCYNATVTWDALDETFTIKNGETIDIIPGHITVKYEMTGKGVYYGTRVVDEEEVMFTNEWVKSDDWQNTFVITFTDVFDLTITEYQERIELGDTPQFKMKVNNNIFRLTDSGFNYKVSILIRDIFKPTETFDFTFEEGEQPYTINLEAKELGLYVGELIPFFDMLPNRPYISDEMISFGYYVSNKGLDCRDSGCTYGTCQDNGQCIITEKVDCKDLGCDIGKCDRDSGNCVVQAQESGEVIPSSVVTSGTNQQYINIPFDSSESATRADVEFFFESNLFWGLVVVALALFIFFLLRKPGKKR